METMNLETAKSLCGTYFITFKWRAGDFLQRFLSSLLFICKSRAGKSWDEDAEMRFKTLAVNKKWVSSFNFSMRFLPFISKCVDFTGTKTWQRIDQA